LRVSAPTFRIEERTDEIVDRLKEAALEVSMRLGWGHRQVTTPE
jgi:DNA-binding IclR family transcriptional regulator